MKRIYFWLSRPFLFAIGATVLISFTSMGGAAYAASCESFQSYAALPVSMKRSDKEADRDRRTENVETRIRDLHDKLQITPDQEDKWKDVANVMRENADRLNALTKERFEDAKNMNAVDDLKSYEKITEAHEKGIENLLPVFKTLYGHLSSRQKKAADAEFRTHRHHLS